MPGADGGGGAPDLATVFSDPDVADQVKQASPVTYDAAATFWRCGVQRFRAIAAHEGARTGRTSCHGDQPEQRRVRRHVGRALAAGATQEDVLDVLITIVGAANHALYFAVPVLMRELQAADHPDAEPPPVTARGAGDQG